MNIAFQESSLAMDVDKDNDPSPQALEGDPDAKGVASHSSNSSALGEVPKVNSDGNFPMMSGEADEGMSFNVISVGYSNSTISCRHTREPSTITLHHN